MYLKDKNGLNFELNKKNFTAKILVSSKASGDIIIPRSVIHDNQEYIITEMSDKIFKNNRNIKSVSFSIESELRSISREAFCFSSIESLSIPPKVEVLQEGWCSGASKLVNISVFPTNSRFLFIKGSYLIWKSDEKSDKYDVLLFASRKIVEAKIFSFIERINSSAFCECSQLKTVDFVGETNLKIIGDDAFASSSLTTVKIPTSVELFGGQVFEKCTKLKNVVFCEDSQLKSISKSAFSRSSIAEISIPSRVETIESRAFAICEKLKYVNFAENSNLKSIEDAAFLFSSIKNMTIPSKVTKIGERAFFFCLNLRSIEFLGESAVFGNIWINHCSKLSLLSFPNIKELSIDINCLCGVSDCFSLFVCSGVMLK